MEYCVDVGADSVISGTRYSIAPQDRRPCAETFRKFESVGSADAPCVVYQHGTQLSLYDQFVRQVLTTLLLALAILTGCSSADGSSGGADDVQAIEIEGGDLTRDQLLALTSSLAVSGIGVDGGPLTLDDELLRTIGTIHVRSTAIINFIVAQEDDFLDIERLNQEGDEDVVELFTTSQAAELESGSPEFIALRSMIIADQISNPLRAEIDPSTGQSVVGNNALTSSFIFNPDLAANFETVSPGFLAQFDETFAEFTNDVVVQGDLGVWDPMTFAITAP